MKREIITGSAYRIACDRIKNMSDDSLLAVWNSANSRNACPELGWGTYVNDNWVVIEWDEWCEILYAELDYRNIAH